MRKLFDSQQRPVSLGRLLGKGGEGAVYEIEGRPQQVAKLYLQSPTPQKSVKLQNMVTCPIRELSKFAAWPVDTLHETIGGTAVGFSMPRIPHDANEIHQLSGPGSRLKIYPKADWAFLIRTALNCAAAFESIHQQGHVIGDVNSKNVVVSSNATIFLIDCDSYQIQGQNGIHFCEVGVPEYTSPELHGKDFSRIVRTQNHDNFGLAVIVFQLLFVGRHPYSGKYLGSSEQLPLEDAIRDYRFAFSRNAQQLQMEPPQPWIGLDDVPPQIAAFFERAFGVAGVLTGRPSATEWRDAISALEKQLRTCTDDIGHKFYAGCAKCPWCEFADKSGFDLFLGVSGTIADIKLTDRSQILSEILEDFGRLTSPAVEWEPGFLPEIAQSQPLKLLDYAPRIPPPPIEPFADKFLRIGLAWFTGIAVLATILTLPRYPIPLVTGGAALTFMLCRLLHQWQNGFSQAKIDREKLIDQQLIELRQIRGTQKKEREENLRSKQDLHNDNLNRWKALVENYVASYQKTQARIDAITRAHKNVILDCDAELFHIAGNIKSEQLKTFLRNTLIIDEKIDGIGNTRRATLATYGIVSAYDVAEGKLNAIKGFQGTIGQNLLLWKASVEQRFRFNPNSGIPPTTRTAILTKWQRQQKARENELRSLVKDHSTVHSLLINRLDVLKVHLPLTYQAMCQAEAELAVFVNDSEFNSLVHRLVLSKEVAPKTAKVSHLTESKIKKQRSSAQNIEKKKIGHTKRWSETLIGIVLLLVAAMLLYWSIFTSAISGLVGLFLIFREKCPACKSSRINAHSGEECLGKRYAHPRTDGGPDRRFKYNPLLGRFRIHKECRDCSHKWSVINERHC